MASTRDRRSSTVRNTPHNPPGYHGFDKPPDMNKEQFEREKKAFLQKLKKKKTEIVAIERATVGQAKCPKWLEEGKIRLTASNFGKICKTKSTTPCTSNVESILYNTFNGNDATAYGIEKEADALKDAGENLLKTQIIPCGIFIDQKNPFLGASPDGLIGTDSIVEIKCPYVARDTTATKAIQEGLINYCIKNKKTGSFELNRNHNYYYQVQGQLNIAKKTICYFVVWTETGMWYEKIKRDTTFWSKMLPKLTEFYMECMLPEMIDPRKPRGLPMRERNSYREK